jgi:hypothetical protein
VVLGAMEAVRVELRTEIIFYLMYNKAYGKYNILHVKMSVTLGVNFSHSQIIQFLYISYGKLSIDLGV